MLRGPIRAGGSIRALAQYTKGPNTRSFIYILQKHQLNPSETLFIDDSIQHINAADSIGIKTIFLDKGMTIEKDIFKPISEI